MNEIDYAILVLVVISIIIGLLRGFVKEALSLLAWATGIYLGVTYNRQFADILVNTIEIPAVRLAVAFIAILVMTLIFNSLMSYLLSLLVKKVGLVFFDRFAGMILGVGRGVLVIGVLVMLLELTPIHEHFLWQESNLIPFFQTFALWLREQLPAEIVSLTR